MLSVRWALKSFLAHVILFLSFFFLIFSLSHTHLEILRRSFFLTHLPILFLDLLMRVKGVCVRNGAIYGWPALGGRVSAYVKIHLQNFFFNYCISNNSVSLIRLDGFWTMCMRTMCVLFIRDTLRTYIEISEFFRNFLAISSMHFKSQICHCAVVRLHRLCQVKACMPLSSAKKAIGR